MISTRRSGRRRASRSAPRWTRSSWEGRRVRRDPPARVQRGHPGERDEVGAGASDRARVGIRPGGPDRQLAEGSTASRSTVTRSFGTGSSPPWIERGMGRRRVAGELALHIETLAGRYRGRVAAWDVVNEAVADPWAACRDTVFRRPSGRATSPRLSGGPTPPIPAPGSTTTTTRRSAGPKSDAVYALVRRLLEHGVPIHGVGLEMHLRVTHPPAPAAIAANVARLTALGLAVRISEMDVRIRRIRRGDPLARQRRVYEDAIAACAGMPGFAGLTFWGVSDAHSWVHEEFGEDAPLLFDREYLPKPAYFGARAALAAGQKARPVDAERPARERAGPEVGARQPDLRHLPQPAPGVERHVAAHRVDVVGLEALAKPAPKLRALEESPDQDRPAGDRPRRHDVHLDTVVPDLGVARERVRLRRARDRDGREVRVGRAEPERHAPERRPVADLDRRDEGERVRVPVDEAPVDGLLGAASPSVPASKSFSV